MIKVIFTSLLILSNFVNASEHAKGISGWEAFNELKNGNQRFYLGKSKHPNQASSRREELAKGQAPHSIVLSCSDSRVPAELIFDQGLGDVFSVRVAGNVVNDENIASIEYAIEHLGSKLILIMGHESCGAVKAALSTPEGSSAGSPSLDRLVADIRPNIAGASKTVLNDDPTVKAPVKSNVSGVLKDLLRRSSIVRESVEKEKVVLAQGIYSLKTGKVEFWDVGQKYVFIESGEKKTESKPAEAHAH